MAECDDLVTCDTTNLGFRQLVKMLIGVTTGGCPAARVFETSGIPPEPDGVELREDGGNEIREDGGNELREE